MRQGLDDDEHPLPFSLLFFSSASNDFVIQMRPRADTDRGVALRSEVSIGGGKPQLHRLCALLRTYSAAMYVCSSRGADSGSLEFWNVCS